MDISVVICTRNRGSQLRACLRVLERLRSGLDWETVVVDNGSTDDTADVLRHYQGVSRRPFIIVDEPRRGLGRARNAGWRAASAPVIAFLDDDCYPAEDFLDRVAECFRASNLGYLGGRILLHDPTDLRLTLLELGQRVDFPPASFIPLGMIQGANLSIRRGALEEVGGFDARLGAGTRYPCEDVEIAARLSARGWVGAFDPRPVVYHHHGRKTEAEAWKVLCGYAVGGGVYYAKCLGYPGMRSLYLRKWLHYMGRQPLLKTLYEIRGAVSFFAHGLWQRDRV
ncbi:MAG: glycosyltransferase family 2 protein [Patescibacteria group bacterium]